MTALEIAVCDVAGARAARVGGADRVELCSALVTGGLTPSVGQIEACAEVLPVHVLIRPRPGDFVYAADEVAVMVRDVAVALAAGASGVVIGAARADGTLDLDVLRRLADEAQGADVTLHRVFDTLDDLDRGLAEAAGLGLTRILTSAGAPRAGEAVTELGRLVRRSRGSVEIMAGGGIRPGDVGALRDVGVAAVHLSARRPVPTGRVGPGGGAATRDVTDGELVAAARAALDSAPAR